MESQAVAYDSLSSYMQSLPQLTRKDNNWMIIIVVLLAPVVLFLFMLILSGASC